MNVLIINQTFFPDQVAVSQYLTDFTEQLANSGHRIKVLAGSRDYENPSIVFARSETYKTIAVERIGSTQFIKKTKFGRLVNFVSFNLALCAHLFFSERSRYDLVIGSTVPPMVGIVASLFSFFHNVPFIYWVMDLQPDEAIAADYLKQNSLIARTMILAGKIPLRLACSIIVLDSYMKERIKTKGITENKISVVPLWPIIDKDSFNDESALAFRKKHGFGEKTVVMYSGNHSVCHPLDTLLEASKVLEGTNEFIFAFVGGGVRVDQVAREVKTYGLKNVIQLPYQKREFLADVLLSADIHIVVMGDPFVGIIHPSKIYGILAVGKPFVFIGPDQCHVKDIIKDVGFGYDVRTGDSSGLVSALLSIRNLSTQQLEIAKENERKFAYDTFGRKECAGRIAAIAENSVKLRKKQV